MDDGDSGSLQCGPAELACEVERADQINRYKDRQRQDKLARLIFPGSGPDGSWTHKDGYRYFRNRGMFWGQPELWNPDGPRSWELFASHADRLAANYSANQRDEFVRDFALVFGGVSSREDFTSAALGSADGPKLPFLTYSTEGLPSIYEDSIDHDNQTHHYAGIFALGYFNGYETASAVNFARDSRLSGEPNPGDIALGEVAAKHGNLFALTGTLNQIGQLISSVIP